MFSFANIQGLYKSKTTSAHHPPTTVARFADILFTPVSPGGQLCFLWARSLYDKRVLRWKIGLKRKDSVDPYFGTDEKFDQFIRSLTEENWDGYGAYMILGLSKLCQFATQYDIHVAFENLCAAHHPQIRRAAGKVVDPDTDYFQYVVAAFKYLSVEKNREFLDKNTASAIMNFPISGRCSDPEEFFNEYEEYFEAASRFSLVQPVPLLGNMFTARAEVEYFYNFWFNFESNRMDLMDQGLLMKNQIYYNEACYGMRERHRVRKNKPRGVAAHGQDGENGRIRKVARDAYKIDPRIPSYKEMDEKVKTRRNPNESCEKSRKERDRERRETNLILQRHLAEEKRLMEKAEAEEKRRLQDEAAIRQVLIKQREEEAKKLGQDEKKALKKARQKLRAVCEKFNYFGEEKAEQMKNMASLEQLCTELSTDELTKLTAVLRENDIAISRVQFLSYVQAMERKVQDFKFESLQSSENNDQGMPGCSLVSWTEEELQILSNVGSMQRKDRWNGIEDIIPGRTKKDCVAKFKEMQKLSKK